MDMVTGASINTINMYVNLNDLYCIVTPQPILYMEGPFDDNRQAEAEAVKLLQNPHNHKLFMLGSDILDHIKNNKLQDHTVNIVVSGLRGVYGDRKHLTRQNIKQIDSYVKLRRPRFVNIYEYGSLAHMKPYVETADYQLIGELSPIDLVTIKAATFVSHITTRGEITVYLDNIDANLIILQ